MSTRIIDADVPVSPVRPPRVTVAIPVYNGERYLEEAILSVLRQTYEDLEVVLCDNASTDSTADICRRFAALDARVRYLRNAVNVGAAPNFNRAFHLARGEYFKWLAADEAIEPTFIARCVAALDTHPRAVLACTNFIGHNEYTGDVGPRDFALALHGRTPESRFRAILYRRAGMVLPIWGLIRADDLRRTGLIGSFIRSDHCLVPELALIGEFVQVPERLAHLRTHADAYHNMSRRTRGIEGRAEARWFDSRNGGRVYFPHWRRQREYVTMVLRCEDSGRAKCRMLLFLLGPFSLRWSKLLLRDVIIAAGGGRLYGWAQHGRRRLARVLT